MSLVKAACILSLWFHFLIHMIKIYIWPQRKRFFLRVVSLLV